MKKLFEKFLYLYFIITVLIFLIFSYFVYESYTLSKKQIINNKILKRATLAYRESPQILVGAISGYFETIKSINIKISNNNLLKIEKARLLAMENKRLNADIAKKSSVSGEIYILEKKTEIKNIRIRLKGDRPIHYAQKKNSSYKIKLKDNNFFLGFNEFGIHKPRARNYIYEWIFHKLMEKEKILGPQYKFINVVINNENKGLYALEESLDNLILNNNIIGPIFYLPDDCINSKNLRNNNLNCKNFSIKSKDYWNKEDNLEIKKKAFNKLYKFINKEASLRETFDINGIAKYVALTDLLMTYHGYSIANIRFHYNPITNLFEFVAWDGHRKNPRYHPWNELFDDSSFVELIEKKNNSLSHLKNSFFWDKEDYKLFLNAYLKEIKRVTDKTYLDNFFDDNKDKIKKYNNLIYKDFFFTDNFDKFGPSFYYFDSSEIYNRANYLSKRSLNYTM